MQCMHSAQRAAAAAATCSAAKSHTTLSLTGPSTHTGGRVSCASLHLASPPSPQQQPASTEAETRDGGKNGILLVVKNRKALAFEDAGAAPTTARVKGPSL